MKKKPTASSSSPSPNWLSSAPSPLTLHLREFQRVSLTLVGCGGTGSHIASGLASLALELGHRGIPFASPIRFIDPDRVELANVGRQLFCAADIGKPKAQVLAERMMAAYGLPVTAHVEPFAEHHIDAIHRSQQGGIMSIVIGAVDNVAARREIATRVGQLATHTWWLDTGNENHSGQVALGNVTSKKDLKHSVSLGLIDRLPAPSIVYPDLIATPPATKHKSKAPSCAELTAAGEQSLMVNRMAAAWALSMLHDLLITKTLHYFAIAFDLNFGGVRSYAIDLPTLAETTGLTESDLQAVPATPAKPSRR